MTRTTNLFLLAGITWLTVASILFFLPGSSLPSSGWMNAIQFDKWVHIGIFSGLYFLWAMSLGITQTKGMAWLAVVSICYGLAVEIIQDRLVTNRSFDVFDLLADSVGIAVGILITKRYIKK